MDEDLIDAMANMREKEAVEIARALVERGEDPINILDLSKKAMEIVGNRFAKGEYFLPELMMAGEMLKQISGMIKPLLKRGPERAQLGKVIIGSVAGDIHNIGKDIVVFMLDVNGFEVIDLGIDVPAQEFIDAIKKSGASIVGLSGFLTLSFDSMKATVEAISQAGLRDKVKIMIGGGQIDEEVRKHTGADEYGLDAMDAVKIAKKWIGGQ